jgi:hypothetical protein
MGRGSGEELLATDMTREEVRRRREQEVWVQKPPWDARVRKMDNGWVALPFSVAFVLKKLENFDSKQCQLDVKMTMIMRIKFHGIIQTLQRDQAHLDKVVAHCKGVRNVEGCSATFLVRIHGDEAPVEENPARSCKVGMAKSRDWREGERACGEAGDMLQYTIRASERMRSDFQEYGNYPFDEPVFRYRFELSSFSIGDDHYTFDFYEQSDNSLAFKEDVDNMPELDVNFLDLPRVEQIEEVARYKSRTETRKCFYYPGFTLVVNTTRDPFPKLVRIFLPLMILGLFLCMTFEVDEYHDRLNNLALCLLTFITIMESTRQELPDIPMLTNSDKFLIAFMVMSLSPVLDAMVGVGDPDTCTLDDGELEEEREQSHCADLDNLCRQIFKYVVMAIQVFMFQGILRKYCRTRAKLNMKPPEQVKSEGGKGKVDKFWKPLQGNDKDTWVTIKKDEERRLRNRELTRS